MEYIPNKESNECAKEKLMNEDYETYTIVFDRKTKVGAPFNRENLEWKTLKKGRGSDILADSMDEPNSLAMARIGGLENILIANTGGDIRIILKFLGYVQ